MPADSPSRSLPRTAGLRRVGLAVGSAVALLSMAAMGACANPRGEYEDYLDRTTTLRGSDVGVSDVVLEVDPSADFSGSYLVGCLPVLVGGDPSLQFMFYIDLKADLAAGTVDFASTALKEDATIFDKAHTTGDPLTKKAIPVTKGQFTATFADASIPGNAQRIGDSNLILKDYSLAMTVTGKDSLCAELAGKIISPLEVDFAPPGDFCIFRRWKEGDAIPKNKGSDGKEFIGFPAADFHCP